jgi:hypothetical protein
MGLFLDGAFSRNLLTGVFELDSVFSWCFCFVDARLPYCLVHARSTLPYLYGILLRQEMLSVHALALWAGILIRVFCFCGTLWAETGRWGEGQ